MFEKIKWYKHKILLNDKTFHLQVHLEEDIREKHDAFVFYKDKKLIDMYDQFFKQIELKESAKGKSLNVLEVGMWDGGSAVFWNEILQPNLFIGIDILDEGGTDVYKNYVRTHSDNFFNYWNTSQTDREKITTIFDRHLKGQSLDLVFDDASHRYHQTLESFNIIFPYLKKGGIYIIEDWAWGHWLHEDSSSYPAFTEPTRLIFELIEAAANIGLIENLYVCSGFTAIIRGKADIDKNHFNLHDYIKRRPVSLSDRIKRLIKKMIGRPW